MKNISMLKTYLNNAGTDGFTLLETIIALAIMVVAFASIIMAESNSIQASIHAKEMNIVAMLARNKMIETEYKIEGKTFDEYKKEENGTFETPYQDYKWLTEVKEIEFPNLTSIQSAGQSPSGGGGSSTSGNGTQGADANSGFAETITKLLTKYLSKSLREVTITVSWKNTNGGKLAKDTKKFSLTTYWVDLNHDFDLSEQ